MFKDIDELLPGHYLEYYGARFIHERLLEAGELSTRGQLGTIDG